MNACKLWSLPFFNVSVVLNVSFLSFISSSRPKGKLLNKDTSFRNCPWTSVSNLQHFSACKIRSWLLFTLHGCQERWMRQFEVSNGGYKYTDVLDKKETSFLFIFCDYPCASASTRLIGIIRNYKELRSFYMIL